MIWLLAIPLCALFYRARGAGWPKTYLGFDDKGVVKAVCLMSLAYLMALPVGLNGGSLFAVVAAGVAMGVAFFTGRAGHGEFYHDGCQAPPRPRHSNAWIGWLPWTVNYEASVWNDRIGLGLTGFLLTAPMMIACFATGQWGYALILACAGLIGKPAAYAVGWRLTGGQTLHGEWLFGAIIGVAVAIGMML